MGKIEIRLQEQMAKNKIRHITDLKEKTGISLTVLYGLINGNKRNLHLDTIERLCKAFDCEIGELIVIQKDGQAVG